MHLVCLLLSFTACIKRSLCSLNSINPYSNILDVPIVSIISFSLTDNLYGSFQVFSRSSMNNLKCTESLILKEIPKSTRIHYIEARDVKGIEKKTDLTYDCVPDHKKMVKARKL